MFQAVGKAVAVWSEGSVGIELRGGDVLLI